MPILLVINGQQHHCDSQIVRIGSATSNTICIPNDAKILPEHAILRMIAGRWIVESKHDGQLRVGGGRPTQFAWINPGDTIRLTESGPELIFDPECTRAEESVSLSVPPDSAGQVALSTQGGNSSPSKGEIAAPEVAPNSIGTPSAPIPAGTESRIGRLLKHLASLNDQVQDRWVFYPVSIGGIVLLLILMLIGLNTFSSGTVVSSGDEVHEKAIPEKVVIRRVPTVEPVVPNAVASVDKPSSAAQANAAKEPATSSRIERGDNSDLAATRPERALFRLELQTTDGKQRLPLGTAWAIGSRQLVTTGEAVQSIKLKRDLYPVAIARHSLTGEKFEIKSTILHPAFESSGQRLEQASREIDKLNADYERAKTPAARQRIEDRIGRLDEIVIQASDESLNLNVALISVDKDIPAELSWRELPTESAESGLRLVMLGHPIPHDAVQGSSDASVSPQKRVGRLESSELSSSRKLPARWLVIFDVPIQDENWSGSPVLDSKGLVVGIYSRPTPRVRGALSGAPETHDVTITGSLRLLIENSKSHP